MLPALVAATRNQYLPPPRERTWDQTGSDIIHPRKNGEPDGKWHHTQLSLPRDQTNRYKDIAFLQFRWRAVTTQNILKYFSTRHKMLFTLALQYFPAETLIVVSGSIESLKSLNLRMSETLESVTWYFYKHVYFNMYWFTTQHMCLEPVVLRNDAFAASLKSA